MPDSQSLLRVLRRERECLEPALIGDLFEVVLKLGDLTPILSPSRNWLDLDPRNHFPLARAVGLPPPSASPGLQPSGRLPLRSRSHWVPQRSGQAYPAHVQSRVLGPRTSGCVLVPQRPCFEVSIGATGNICVVWWRFLLSLIQPQIICFASRGIRDDFESVWQSHLCGGRSVF